GHPPVRPGILNGASGVVLGASAHASGAPARTVRAGVIGPGSPVAAHLPPGATRCAFSQVAPRHLSPDGVLAGRVPGVEVSPVGMTGAVLSPKQKPFLLQGPFQVGDFNGEDRTILPLHKPVAGGAYPAVSDLEPEVSLPVGGKFRGDG